MDGGDLVFYKEGGRIMAGGYPINSFFLKNDIPASINLNRQAGGSHLDGSRSLDVSSIFHAKGIPAPLLYNYHECKINSQLNQEDIACISEEMYSNILTAANVYAKNKIKVIHPKNYTQRHNRKGNHSTEKMRNGKEYTGGEILKDEWEGVIENPKKRLSKRKKGLKRVFTRKH